MKIAYDSDPGDGSWSATGDSDSPEMRGAIFYVTASDEEADMVGVEPNRHLRLGAIRQGLRSENPYLQKSSLFPLLYLLPRMIDLREVVEFMRDDVLEQLKHEEEFQRFIWFTYLTKNRRCDVEAKSLWNYETSRLWPDCYMEADLHFNPTDPRHLCEAAKTLFERMLYHAALQGPERLHLVAKAAEAIDKKTTDLFYIPGDCRIKDSDTEENKQSKHMHALLRAIRRSKKTEPSESEVVALFHELRESERQQAEAQILKLQHRFSEWLTYEPEGNCPNGEERAFLESLRDLVREKREVPTQKQAREGFIAGRAGRSEEQWKRLRDTLGFRWLPHAKRGRKRENDEK